ncbi:hypothetical protein KO507_20025, partial [Gilvimarinus agarilyticus]|nr:hypothetical protein [Gilvimarinus agarilyticus]
MKALGIYFLVNLITISLLFSQQVISDYQFVTIDQELSQNTVSAMAQDQEGFLWIGSRSGLNRYDGINMMSFMHDERDSTSLCNNYIRSLYIGTNNRVFVGSLAGGYCIYNDTDGTFGNLPTADRYLELVHVTVNAF